MGPDQTKEANHGLLTLETQPLYQSFHHFGGAEYLKPKNEKVYWQLNHI